MHEGIMIMWSICGSRMEENRIEIWFLKDFFEMQVTN
jgi:hypothetical protein